jgi:hypothetical protein
VVEQPDQAQADHVHRRAERDGGGGLDDARGARTAPARAPGARGHAADHAEEHPARQHPQVAGEPAHPQRVDPRAARPAAGVAEVEVEQRPLDVVPHQRKPGLARVVLRSQRRLDPVDEPCDDEEHRGAVQHSPEDVRDHTSSGI